MYRVLWAFLLGISFTQACYSQQADFPGSPQRFTVSDSLSTLDGSFDDLEKELAALKQITRDSSARLSELEVAQESLKEATEKNREQLEKTSGNVDKINDKVGNLVRAGHSAATMKLSGRIHLDYWAFPQVDTPLFALEGGDPQDEWVFRRLRFGVAGDISQQLEYKIEMEFQGGNDPSYRDAYIGINDLPILQTVLIGNHKRPYGLDHINSSRYNIFLERPYIVEALNQDSRRLGISANGFSEDLRFNWRYGYYNMELTQGIGGYIGDHYQGELVGRLAMTPWYDDTSDGRGYLHMAVAGGVGDPDGLDPSNNAARFRTRAEDRTENRWLDTGRIAGANGTYLGAIESVLNIGAFQLGGELMSMNVDRRAGFGNNVHFYGGYVYAAYFLTGEHMTWERETGQLGRITPLQDFFCVNDRDGRTQRGWGAWQLAARYSAADLTDEDIFGGVGRSWTFGANWYWNPYCRWQFNYILGNIEREPLGSGDFKAFGLRFMVDF